jgi:hypothetical protein
MCQLYESRADALTGMFHADMLSAINFGTKCNR